MDRSASPRITLMVAWWPAAQHAASPGYQQQTPGAKLLQACHQASLHQPSESHAAETLERQGWESGVAESQPCPYSPTAQPDVCTIGSDQPCAGLLEAGSAMQRLQPAMRMPRPGSCLVASRKRKADAVSMASAPLGSAWLPEYRPAHALAPASASAPCTVHSCRVWSCPPAADRAWTSLSPQHCLARTGVSTALILDHVGPDDGIAAVPALCQGSCEACAPLPSLQFFLRSAAELEQAYSEDSGHSPVVKLP